MSVQSFRAATAALVMLSCAAPAPAQGQLQASAAQAVAPAGPARMLTMDEAVQLALEQNLNLRVERINPQIQDEVVDQARAVWLPVVFGGGSYNNADSPPDSFLSGSERDAEDRLLLGQRGRAAGTAMGCDYQVSFDGSRSTSNNIFNTFNPRVRSNLNLTYSQPLLRNRAIDGNRQQLLISRNNRQISDFDLRATVVATIRSVRNAYVDLSFARANLRVQQQSLELAEQTLRDNRTRVEVGTMAPIDIIEAEAEVARNEENVIVAEAQITQAEDRLRALVFDPGTPEFWRISNRRPRSSRRWWIRSTSTSRPPSGGARPAHRPVGGAQEPRVDRGEPAVPTATSCCRRSTCRSTTARPASRARRRCANRASRRATSSGVNRGFGTRSPTSSASTSRHGRSACR
jgi:hypothetical protein